VVPAASTADWDRNRSRYWDIACQCPETQVPGPPGAPTSTSRYSPGLRAPFLPCRRKEGLPGTERTRSPRRLGSPAAGSPSDRPSGRTSPAGSQFLLRYEALERKLSLDVHHATTVALVEVLPQERSARGSRPDGSAVAGLRV